MNSVWHYDNIRKTWKHHFADPSLSGVNTLKSVLPDTVVWVKMETAGHYLPKTRQSGEKTFYHQDHLGSTNFTTDEEGNVTGRYEYYPYGKERLKPSANPFYKHTNHETDLESALVYSVHRYRDTVTGQFLSTDPLADKYPGWSPYNYAANNPNKYIDPDGRFIWMVVGGIVGAGSEYAIQVAENLAQGNNLGDALTNVDGTSIAVSAVAGTLTGGLGYAAKAVKGLKAAKRIKRNQAAMKRGRANEAKTIAEEGLTKNNKTFTVKIRETGEQIRVKPDAIGKNQISEIKDVKTLSNTKQIRGERQLAKEQNKEFKIYTGTNTKVSRNIPESEIIRKPDLGP